MAEATAPNHPQQHKQRPLHYAFVSPSEPLELPVGSSSSSSSVYQQQQQQSNIPQESLVQLYQSYAERYPNPRLIEEYQERDQLLQATSAAHSANPRHNKKQKKSGWFGSLFGGTSHEEDGEFPLPERNLSPEEDQWLEYTEVHDDNTPNDLTLCGTHQSLDRSCIPPEAHSMARLSLVSSRTCQERPLVVRASPHLPSDPTFVIVDVGIIAELVSANDDEEEHPNDNNIDTDPPTNYSKTSITADRDDLQQYASSRGGFDLGRVRAASLGPNFLVVSWGFSDGIVVFYRRIHMPHQEHHEVIGWEPVVFLGPSQAVLEHSYDAFVDEEDEDANSALLRITDIVPLVVTTPGMPAAALAVSRLGGYMEVLPIPPPLWYGPAFSPDKHKPRGGGKRPKKRHHNNHKSLHYAKPYLVDISSDKAPIPILALTTMEYQMDILCLEAIRTRVTVDTEWDRDRYGNAPPPAEYILVASGTQQGHEILTFWSVSYLFAEEPPTDGSAGFTLHAVLQEALDVGPVGADLSIFANRAILNQWRQPRKVSLKEQPPPPVALGEDDNDDEESEGHQHPEDDNLLDDDTKPLSVYDRVTTITVSAPIVTMQSITVPTQDSGSQMVLLSLLDWNGSVTVMDCSFLERMVSHCLSEEEYQAVRSADMVAEGEGQEPPPVPELVKTLAERSRVMEWMKSTSSKRHFIYQCTNVQWLARADNAADPWLILLTSPWHSPSSSQKNTKSGRIMILSGFLGSQSNLEHPSIQTVAFPTDSATLQGNTTVPMITDGDHTLESSSSLLRIVFRPKKQRANQLCVCLLQPLESQDIIASLARDGKYKQALAAAQELSTEEQQQVKDTLEECRQHLWEQSGDLIWLKQVADDAYVIRQALSLFESSTASGNEGERSHITNSHYLERIDVDMCRDICSLALQRVSKLRLGSALTLGYGTEDARAKLQGMLVRLGTYELLCQSLNADLSFPRFRQLFVNVSVVHLAKSFAPLSDLTALSIMWFRHASELQPHMIDILTELPMTLDPLSFCHLLPIAPKPHDADDDHSSLFLTGLESSAGNKLLHISQLPSHLRETFQIKVILDGNDEKNVLDHNNSTASSPSDDLSEEKLLSFYVSRAKAMQRFSGNLQYVAAFCALGVLAGRKSVEQLEAASADGALPCQDTNMHELYCTWGCAVALQKMLVESAADAPMEGEEGGLLDLEPFVTVTPLDLSSMELAEIVKMVLGGQDDAEIIIETYKDYLLPLLKFIPGVQTSDLDEAIKSYCIHVVRSSVFHPIEEPENNGGGDDRMVVDDNEDGTLKALQICRAIAYGSRTTIRKSERIIQEKKVLIKLVLAAIFDVSLRCESASMPKKVCQTIVKLMWDMYESMPDDAAEVADADEEFAGLMAKANDLYKDLVGLNILSQWPNCHAQAFSFLIKRMKAREDTEESDGNSQRVVVDQEALASLCRSFCSQAASQKGAIGLSDLLRDLTSDIKQLCQICYGKDEAYQSMLVETLSAEMINPLFRQREFELVAQFLSEADESWWDKEQEARSVGSFVDEIVFSDDVGLSAYATTAGENPLESAMACQDVLGQVFPELQTGFQSVRRYLDAAHFINTVIFAELKMPKPIKPNDLRGDLPLDVVESILKALPKAVVIGCQEWGEASLAVHANKALREFHEKAAQAPEEPEPKNLPPIPGGAVFHLAGILGLEDTASVLVVKSRVVHHGVSSGLFGASAAVCRTILYDDNAFSSPEDSVVRLGAVAEVVTQDGFDDLLTKRELCVAALQKHQGNLSVENCKPFNAILKVFSSLEPKTSQAQDNENKPQILNLPPPSDSMGCLYKDTWGQYSVNIYELFSTLQQHTSECTIDDSLLNALGRYVFFSCIFRSTRPRSELPGKLEKATSNHLLILGASLLLHIKEPTSISIPALKELRQILEKQAMAVINQHPTAFEDFVKVPNEDIVRELIGRGFTPMAARRSAQATRNAGTQQALQWGVTNARDPRMNDPIIFVANKRNLSIDKMFIQQIMNTFAFSAQFLSGAKTIEEWLLEHPINISSQPMAPPTLKTPAFQSEAKVSKTFGINGGSASSMTAKTAKSHMHTPKEPPKQPSPPPQPKLVMKTAPKATPAPKKEAVSPAALAPSAPTTGGESKNTRSAPDLAVASARPPAKAASAVPVPLVPASIARAPDFAAAAKPPPPPPAKPADAGFSSEGAFQPKVPQIANRGMPQPSASSTEMPAKDASASRLKSLQQQKDAIGTHFNSQGQVPAKTTPAARASIATANKFTTPTNRPPSLHLGKSTGSSTSSDYDTLKNRGKTAMQSMRSSPQNRAQTREERRRLIEAGRRLLAKSRASNPASPKESISADKPAFGARPVDPSTRTSTQQAARPGTIAAGMSATSPGSASDAKPAGGFGIVMGSPGDSKPQAGWGFDEDDGLGDVESAVEASEGWNFDEEPNSVANGAPAQVPTPTVPLPTTTNGDTQIEKLEVDEDEGWDFDDF